MPLSPFLRHLLPPITLAYALQGLVAVPSIAAHSERFYDASGALTYLSCTAFSLALPALRARHAATVMKMATSGAAPNLLGRAWGSFLGGGFDMGSAALMKTAPLSLNWRQVALSAAVGVWATRCK